MSFPCTRCGACCKLAGAIPGFPEPVTASRQCVHLAADNTCLIYRQRPEICRIRGDYAANAAACNTLQTLTNAPKKFRLPVDNLQEPAKLPA